MSSAEPSGGAVVMPLEPGVSKEPKSGADAVYAFVDDIMPLALLQSGDRMPLVGLGTAGAAETSQAVAVAIRSGYRHIDCAEFYKNQAEIGQALKEVFDEGVVKREDLFLTSKVWNNHHSKADVKSAIHNTLRDLGVSYLDLYLIHWPVVSDAFDLSCTPGETLQPPIRETWEAMEELAQQGLVKSIGVSNFSVKKLGDLLTYAKIVPAVNQVEVNPHWRQDKLIQFCRSNGVHVTAYSPLGSPGYMDSNLLQDPIVKEISERLCRSPAQCLIRWAIQHGTSVIPKSTNPDRIKSNLDVLSWELPAKDYQALCSVEKQHRSFVADFFTGPNCPYKSAKDLWDDDDDV